MDDQAAAQDYQQLIDQKDREIRRLQRQLRNRAEIDAKAAVFAASKNSVDALIQSEMKRQEKFMNLLLNNSPDMILLLDQTGRMAYCTDSFLKRINIAEFGLINGHHYKQVFDTYGLENWSEQFDELFDAFMDDPVPSTFTVFSNVDEQEHQYQVHFAPTLNEEGLLEGSIILMHDVSALTNALRLAEEASVSKTNFLSNMSHEIRTPISAIIGMSQIAKNADELNKIQYCIDKIDTASSHLLGIINDILDMSKIESGKFELSPTIFDLERMVMNVSSVQAFRMDEKNLEYIVDLSTDIPKMIKSDEQRIAQVITNLISNAVKFTPEFGRVKLLIEVSEETDEQIQIRISVCDTGIGISEEKRSKLFRSFEQGDSGVARKFGGTGLGLVISKNIVEMMGGSIWVESEVGKGSDFIFTIWADKCNDLDIASIDGLSWVDLSELRILVVDDSNDALDHFLRLVKNIDENVQCDLTNGENEAISMIEKADTPYHIVFVDWLMPGIDSVELIAKIREKSVDSEIIIMAQSRARETVESKSQEIGVAKILPKPLFVSNILKSILETLHDSVSHPFANDDNEKSEENDKKDIFVGLKLLLVEDVEINREIAMALLEETGVKIVCAEDGEIACSTFASDPDSFDVILMDLQMPVVDGLEATRRIRAMDLAKAKEIPIIAMTANVFKEDIDRCMESGMNSHLGKPINIDELIATLKQYLPVD